MSSTPPSVATPAAIGGGLFIAAGTVDVTNSTLSGNTAGTKGGAVYQAGGYLTVTDSTLSGNSAPTGQGGGLFSTSGLAINGTIIAANTGGDLAVSGAVLSGSNDLIGDGSDSGTLTSSARGSSGHLLNPHLSALGFFGGPTQTMALLAGSLAIGHGADFPVQDANNHDITGTDQPRARRGRRAITLTLGAFQSGVNIAPVITSPAAATFFATIGGTFTITGTGFPAAALTQTGTLPSGVTFADHGSGSATLTVSPSAAAGVVHLTLKAANGILPNATQSFTLTITQISTFTVTTLADSGAGSLRQAILDSNSIGGLTIINVAGGLSGSIELADGLPFIDSNLTLNGSGLTIDGQGQSGTILTVDSGFTVSMNHLTITGGGQQGSAAGGIFNGGNLTISDSTISGNAIASDSNGAGGIYNVYGGTLSVIRSTIAGNSAYYGAGGIVNKGTATVLDSTISGNVGTTSASSYAIGGIYNSQYCQFTLVNSTIAGNSGAGVFNAYNATSFSIVDSTISGNSISSGGAAGIYSKASGAINLYGTIVAGNNGGDISGAIIGGNDLIGDGSGGNLLSDSLQGTGESPLDPKLGPLANNGGPTQTMALLSGSPALGDQHQLY